MVSPAIRPMSSDWRDYVCPHDGSELQLRAEAEGAADGAALTCEGGAHRFPVVDGIPRFVGGAGDVARRSSRRFGYKWQVFHRINDHYVKNFLDEIRPLDDAFFEGKVILDAGCGIGIPSYCMSRMRPAKIHAADVSPSVEVARRNTRDSGLVRVAQADIHHLPYRPDSFDVVVCVAVLQHLPDHRAALDALLRPLKPGGTLVLWVYGREGNALVERLVEPLRRAVTRRLPLFPLLAASFALAVPFHFVLLPAVRLLAALGVTRLPMHDYLLYRADFPFSNNVEMIFDQLLAPESHLFEREEVEALLRRDDVERFDIRRHNQNSWSAFAVKAGRGGQA